jgi:hypothetical protein
MPQSKNWSHISFSYRDDISVGTCYYRNSNMRWDNRKDTHLPKYNVLIIYALKRPACIMQQNPIQKVYEHNCTQLQTVYQYKLDP